MNFSSESHLCMSLFIFKLSFHETRKKIVKIQRNPEKTLVRIYSAFYTQDNIQDNKS